MSSNILLVSTNQCVTPDPVFPLGLACLNAALRQAGHRTIWYDHLVNSTRLEDLLRSSPPDFIAISLRNIDDVLIRKQETYYQGLADLRDAIRRHSNSPIIVGGSGFSIFPRELLEQAGADFGIIGAGESSLVRLINSLESGTGYCEIPGLVYRGDSKINVNAAEVVSAHALDESDRPEEIASHYLRSSGMLNVQTQRGCAFSCCYCTYPVIEGRRHLRRPPEQVAIEFEQLQRRGVRYIFITDSVFNSSRQHISELCEAILHRNVKMAWGCFLRPQGLNVELLKLMARAGLTHIEFGSDSFCDEVLNAYEKNLTFEDIVISSESAQAVKVDFCHFLIAGGPGETTQTLEESFDRSLCLKGAVIMAVVGMRIYPGTGLYQRAVSEGLISQHTDLLTPAYYLAQGLTAEGVFEQLQHFARRSPNWIVGDPTPGYRTLVQRLRQRGAVGPLWSYFAQMQRLWPQGVPKGTAS